MADVTTAIYKFTLPEVGASEDTWGTKLNADLTKLETLFTSAFTGGTATLLGLLKSANLPDIISKPITWTTSITVENTAPYIRLHDTQGVDPIGRWRMYAISDNLYFQKSTGVNWASAETALTMSGTTKEIIVSAPYSLQLSTTAVEIASSTAELRFRETDQAEPGGRYRFVASGGSFSLQKSTSATWTTATTVWGYSPTTGVATFSAAAAFTGDVRITNTQPVLWLQDTNAATDADWAVYASGSLRFATATTAGVPSVLKWNITPALTTLYESILEIQSSYPTLQFSDTTPSGDAYFTITGGNGVMRFHQADNAGVSVNQMASLSRAGGLSVTGDITASLNMQADAINARLTHPNAGGYVNIGSYSSTYGSGYGQFYWSENGQRFYFQGSLDTNGTFYGSGAGLTNVSATQIVSNHGGVGTYRMLLSTSGGDNSGAEMAGTDLRTPYFQVNSNSTSLDISYGNGPGGTWRAMQGTTCASDERCIALT